MFAKTEGRLFGQRNADPSRGDDRTQPSQNEPTTSSVYEAVVQIRRIVADLALHMSRQDQNFAALFTAIEEVNAQIRKRRYVETDERDRKIDAPVHDSDGSGAEAIARVFGVQSSPQPTIAPSEVIEYPYSKDQPSPSPTYVAAYLAYMELSRAFDRVDTLDNYLSKRERAFLRSRFFRDSAR